MKRMVLAVLALAVSGMAANFDGKWAADVAAGKKSAAAKPTTVTFHLKSDGSQLTGSVNTSRGKRARPVSIQDGKIDGDRFTFTTMQHGKMGDVKVVWQGSLQGEQLTGTRTRDGAKHGAPFTAKRQS